MADYGTNDPISDKTRRLATVIGKESTGRILALLYTKPYQSASEIARIENIHIATAQKYLREMKDAGLLGVRVRRSGTRPTEEFFVIKPKIEIGIDLGSARPMEDLEKVAAITYVREINNLDIAYETDRNSNTVREIVLMDDEERKHINQRITLSELEGKFYWHIPYHSEEPKSIMQVIKDAKIPKSSLPQLMDLVERLSDAKEGMGIIESVGRDKKNVKR